MIEKIERIKEKLSLLKKLDKNYKVFGSENHKYKLNKRKTEQELIAYEKEYSITLPKEYRSFLKNIGNGGAGPYYGLEPLENGRFSDLEYKRKDDLIDLAQPFLHTTPWNFIEITAENEEEYFENKWINGLLRISNFGCGVSINLVVNGAEHGNLWVDDRCNDQGIFPETYSDNNERIQFLDWYEAWLDKELKILF
ncbi:SMI1/KNR4 family protein [uncultured Tenacibaculum sp.]|uniref:SMI1/KNR4 family protein n=1 Tax=uncultured Tenacibaculum sp. TaxID=174713 RepID=UPI002611E59A|nr:SMI1/KNR4 family protein [uncultured Tenacibaculum sp.]